MTNIPKLIKIVIVLIFTYLITELMRCYLYFTLTEVFGESLTKTFQIAGFLTNLFLVYNISLRQNWARICLIIFYLIDTAFCYRHIVDEFDFDLSIGIISVVKKMLQLIIVIILLSKSSNNWFNYKINSNSNY